MTVPRTPAEIEAEAEFFDRDKDWMLKDLYAHDHDLWPDPVRVTRTREDDNLAEAA